MTIAQLLKSLPPNWSVTMTMAEGEPFFLFEKRVGGKVVEQDRMRIGKREFLAVGYTLTSDEVVDTALRPVLNKLMRLSDQ